MPPAITVSPRRVTPSRAYCTAQTSRSPKPSPSRAHVWPRRKNSNQNGLCNKFSYFTGFGRFRAGGEDGLETEGEAFWVRWFSKGLQNCWSLLFEAKE